MPNIEYYSDVKVLKKPLKERAKRVFKIFLFLFVVVSCFLGAKYLSGALTVGNLGALIVYGDTSLKIDNSTLYAVTLGEYDTFEKAEQVALGATIQGASGFVWQDSKYYVIGNIYPTEKDALSVMENLKETNYNIALKEIPFNSLKLDFSMYENKDMQIVNKAFKVVDKVYNSLYNYSIDFDKGEVSHLAVSSYISSLRGEVKSIIIDVQNLLNKSSSDLKNLQTTLIKIDEILDQAIIKVIDNTSTNYSLKYSISSVVRVKFELFNKLSA